jgi:hypothetical protein
MTCWQASGDYSIDCVLPSSEAHDDVVLLDACMSQRLMENLQSSIMALAWCNHFLSHATGMAAKPQQLPLENLLPHQILKPLGLFPPKIARLPRYLLLSGREEARTSRETHSDDMGYEIGAE